jgi:hypothetical protein
MLRAFAVTVLLRCSYCTSAPLSTTLHYRNGKPKHISLPHKSFITIINQKTFFDMSPSQVQIQLQKSVIVIPDMKLPCHAFSHQGICDLNSMDTDVGIRGIYKISHIVATAFSDILQGQSLVPLESSNIKMGTMDQFFQNAEAKTSRKILRVIHAPSDSMEQLAFTTDYLAWRETRSQTYCREEQYSSIGALRWNDYDNANAIQQWSLVPHGFGLYLQIHAGSKWIIIGSPADFPFEPEHFSFTEIFLPEFVETQQTNQIYIHLEAILLRQGMQM